jgi:uncharacterized membrane protein YeiH
VPPAHVGKKFLQSIPFETIGVAVFALSGALMAARKGMDPFGFSPR